MTTCSNPCSQQKRLSNHEFTNNVITVIDHLGCSGFDYFKSSWSRDLDWIWG